MTAFVELSGALPDLATSGVGFAGWSSGTPTEFERPGDLTHIKVETPALAFDTPDLTAISYSPQPLVELEKPIVYPPRVIDALLPPGMTEQQFLAGFNAAVGNKYGISMAAFDAVWGDDKRSVNILPPQRDNIISALISQERPSRQPAMWHKEVAEKAYQRLARETGYTADDIRAMNLGDNIYGEIHRDMHLRKLWEKAERHERHRADAREKQAKANQNRADEQYAANYASNMYEPIQTAREKAMAANDAKAEHVSYTNGRPTNNVDFEGYAQHVDVNGKTLTAIHQAYDPRAAQDLAQKAEEAIEAAILAQNDLTRAKTDGDPGAAYLMAGMPLSAIAYKGGRIGKALAMLIAGGSVLTACGGAPALENPTVHPPTPPPEPTHIPPTLIDAPAAPESYVGYNPVDLVEAPGVLPGAGGQEGSQIPVKMTDPLHERLLAQGWAPVYDSATKNYALIGGTAADNSVTCFSTTRDQMFGPRPDLDIHPLRGVESGVAIFTDPSGTVAEQTVMNVSLVGAPEGATCIQAINNNSQSSEYTLLKLLLIGPNGDVLGAIPTFSGDDRVVVQWSETDGPQLFVNGNKTWFES
ncbi:MAG: hypothetical protein AAB481_02795, partial [Patescibacteria group bacterium]